MKTKDPILLFRSINCVTRGVVCNSFRNSTSQNCPEGSNRIFGEVAFKVDIWAMAAVGNV